MKERRTKTLNFELLLKSLIKRPKDTSTGTPSSKTLLSLRGEQFTVVSVTCLFTSSRYVLTNAGEPLNEIEAEQMMKEADKDGDGTIDYEGLY